MDPIEEPPAEYISYNGLGRNPSVWGIPYMAGLALLSVSMLGGMVLGLWVGPVGWSFALIGVPIGWFIKTICTNDDHAIGIVVLEAKWVLIKLACGNAKYHGQTMAIAPTTYGRRLKNVQRYFEKTVGRGRTPAALPLPR
ncbi:VirB3 family type IV secretion system protein [Variovorax saccharolyticus]|uniref:VirB3 family type IV secretion system protein n=1 Tax=Variovorax saccharolyticus TaxID=3053516 RepID=UPI0025784E65|nr:VirB3 family type IV secretion system protein [Variovorax sp. J31P216]MDM0029124.1 VirB3 family type IV secretion system protein [Variovorax sp. J31P216]